MGILGDSAPRESDTFPTETEGITVPAEGACVVTPNSDSGLSSLLSDTSGKLAGGAPKKVSGWWSLLWMGSDMC